MKKTVYIVDDDPSVLRSLTRFLKLQKMDVISYSSALEYLKDSQTAHPSCLLLDIFMPELDGLKLHEKLQALDTQPPVIFITGKGDIPMSVQAIKAGAFDFLEKPIDSKLLVETVERALAHDSLNKERQNQLAELRNIYRSLTAREQEVFEMITSGKINKQIAFKLGISMSTVKFHRSNMMHKLQVSTVAELVKIREKLNL